MERWKKGSAVFELQSVMARGRKEEVRRAPKTELWRLMKEEPVITTDLYLG